MSNLRALVSIAGHDLPDPYSYAGNTADLVDSGRNVNGVVIGDVIRYDVAKVELKWNYLTASQWAEILRLFNRAAGGNFYNSVTFFNQGTADWTTRTMYVSDRKASMWRRDEVTGEIFYTDASLNLIEV